MFLGQMPAARAHEQDGRLRVQLVLFALRTGELDVAANRVAQVDLARQIVLPGGRVRVLEIRHEDVRAGVQRVDDHLAVHGPGDLDAPVEQIAGNRRDHVIALADLGGFRQKIGQLARVDSRLALDPAVQKSFSLGVKFAVKIGDESDGFGGKDLGHILGESGASIFTPSRAMYGLLMYLQHTLECYIPVQLSDVFVPEELDAPE